MLGVTSSLAHASVLSRGASHAPIDGQLPPGPGMGPPTPLGACPASQGPGCAPGLDGALTQGFRGPVGHSLTPLCSLESSASPRSGAASHTVCREDPETANGCGSLPGPVCRWPILPGPNEVRTHFIHLEKTLSVSASFSIKGKNLPKRHLPFLRMRLEL